MISDTGTMRILVVDDDEALRLTIAANLELEDFDVTEACSAAEALEQVRTKSFDVALSDIRMPEKSGVELFEEIRHFAPDLPVVLMTAFTTEKLLAEAIERGVFTVLGKPFGIDEAVRTLQRAARRPIVLVVDDEVPVATTTADALRSKGVSAEAVFDAAEAVRAIRNRQIDVCVIDLMMPETSGVELAGQVRNMDDRINVIVVSGAVDADNLMREAAARGAFRCLRKPVNPVELIHSIAAARATS